jgi:TetR/AcrR family transcriptional regulator, cholesterol catabolism regulator
MKRVSDRPRSRVPEDPTRRADQIREEIFQRAIALFEQNGFRATSMQDIADACGVTKPTIYYYFKNKYDLLATLYTVVTRDFYDMSEALVHSDLEPATKLRRLIEAQVLYSVDHWQFQKLFLQERRELKRPVRSALAARERRYEELVGQVLEEGRRQGAFRVVDSRLATLTILGLLSSVHRWARYSGLDSESLASGIVDLVAHGIAGQPGDEAAPGPKRGGIRRAPSAQRRSPRATPSPTPVHPS